MKIQQIKTTIPPFMGGKSLRNYQPKPNNLEYVKKKWSNNDKFRRTI